MPEKEPEQEKPILRLVGKDEPGSMSVVELGSGAEVFHPDIAEKALGIFGAAIESAGGEFEAPDDISSLFSEEVRGIRPVDPPEAS